MNSHVTSALSMVRLPAVFSALALVFLTSCVSHDFPDYFCPDEVVSYQADVHSIVMTKCAVATCHGSDPNLPDWTNFSVFQEEARNGKVKEYVVNGSMPPAGSAAGPLSHAEIGRIVCWIDQGAQDN